MPWREMLRRMDARELMYQQAYDQVFDDPEWQRTGVICQTIAGTSWSPRNLPITDFMPERDRPVFVMNTDEVMRAFGAPI